MVKSTKEMLRDTVEARWLDAKRSKDYQLALLESIPDDLDIDDIHFINDESIFMYSVNTLKELLAQVAKWEAFKPEISSYNLFTDDSVVCVYTTSLGFAINTYCYDVEAVLAYYSGGNCVVETVTSARKALKCVRAK